MGMRVRRAVSVAIVSASLALGGAASAIAADKPAASPNTGASRSAHPDLSGYWNLATTRVARDKTLLDKVPAGTAMLEDTGAVEFPKGEFGGLKLKPKALAAADA